MRREPAPYLYKAVRDRLKKKEGRSFLYLDGRPIPEMPPLQPGMGLGRHHRLLPA